MKSTLSTTILALALVGCTGGVVEMPIVDTTWSLQADGDDALVDLAHVDFGAYPNPKSLKQMYVMLQDDGTLCANDGKKDWCGGPVQGIPYLTILNVRPDSYCVRVVDIFGNYVRTACQDACPAGAIDFGNLLNPDESVTHKRALGRRYDLLAYVGARPRTSYLARIKNPNPAIAADRGVGGISAHTHS